MKMGMMEKEMMKMGMMEKEMMKMVMMEKQKQPSDVPKDDNTTPQCALIVTDVPKGDNTTPQCSLRNTAGDKYCALMSPCPIIIHQIFNKSLFKFQFKLAH